MSSNFLSSSGPSADTHAADLAEHDATPAQVALARVLP
jgi:hypothetical protein